MSHFCEIHGPTSILVTQALTPSQAESQIPHGSSSDFNHKQQLCNSCRLTFPNQVPSNTTCMRTVKVEPHGSTVAYLSTQYPGDPRRFMAIRQACLQMLSSEHTFNDATPLMVADPGLGGAAMGLVFKVRDESSRGHVRKYALVCVCDHEQMLMGAWSMVVSSLSAIKTSIQRRAAAADDSCGVPSTPDNRFLRRRDSRVPPKSLTVILKDDCFFGEIHAKFTYLLSMLNKRFMFP